MADETTTQIHDMQTGTPVDAQSKRDPLLGLPPALDWTPPLSAVDRLRAFEDEKVGADAPRFSGALERGVGSLFSRMPEADKAMHGKLEKLVETEAKLAAAHTALIAADNEHDAALKAVDG